MGEEEKKAVANQDADTDKHENEDDGLIPDDVIDDMFSSIGDPKTRDRVKHVFKSEVGVFSGFSPQLAVMKKINEEHITTFLKTQDKSLDYNYKDDRNKKVFFAIILIIVCAVILAIIGLLKDSNPEQMERIITVLVSAVLGAAGGYGVGYKKGKDGD